MTVEAIPLVDLRSQHEQVAADIAAGWGEVLQSCRFILGPKVDEFELAFATAQGVAHCAAVANGTDALELAARAVGLRAGDAVLVPANTFAATALAFMRMGLKPVLADCDPHHLLLDPAAVAARITPAVRAVVPVHLFGQMAPMELIAEAAGPDVTLIEDAAQAQGARRRGQGAGSVGRVAATSFYPGKNLGAYGDAGAVLTQSGAIARQVRALRNYGSEVKYHHPEAGFNSRLDELQAVVLSAKLKHLAHWNELRSRAAVNYDRLLADLGERVQRPAVAPGNEHVWHLYVLRVANRDRVLERLNAVGIGAAIHYPHPLHLLGAFAGLGYRRGDFPVAERAAGEILSLPLYPGISEAQQERVAAELKRALD